MGCPTSDCTACVSYPSARGEANERRIYREYHAGTALTTLAQRFRRAPDDIARLVERIRAEQILGMPLSYVPHEQFSRIYENPAMEEAVLGPPPVGNASPQVRAPRGVPAYVASLYEVPLLTRSQETHLFREMNYLKYKADLLRKELDPRQPSSALMDRIDACRSESVIARNQLIRANLRLVVSVAKRHVGPTNSFFELVSDGNVTLMRAVEKFDFSRGTRFSSYAIEAMENSFARSIPAERRRHNRFRTTGDVESRVGADLRLDPFVQEKADSQRRSEVTRILNRLDARDRQMILRRFGLQHGCQAMKLREISAEMGVSKERVRQIVSRAIGELHGLAIEEKIELRS